MGGGGGGNPIRQIISTVGETARNVVLNPIREGARAVGADGIVSGINQIQDGTRNFDTQIGEFITGEGQKRDKEREAENAEGARKEGERIDAENKRNQAEATAAIENERMAAGSKSRTLLTGPRGLEDETDADGKPITISRRTLRAK